MESRDLMELLFTALVLGFVIGIPIAFFLLTPSEPEVSHPDGISSYVTMNTGGIGIVKEKHITRESLEYILEDGVKITCYLEADGEE